MHALPLLPVAAHFDEPRWRQWCALFHDLKFTPVETFELAEDCSDLSLHFQSGHRLETFGNCSAACWWYYRDQATGELYEVRANEIRYTARPPARDVADPLCEAEG